MNATQRPPSRPEWYSAGDTDPMLEPAREAFIIAAATFSTKLTSDPCKAKFVSEISDISHLQKVVTEAQLKYKAKDEKSAVRKWLRVFSKRVNHYGAILDVLVSHHPEYVALVWGAMKFLFVALDNHEALITCIAKGLAEIADNLPVVEVVTILFPTERMKLALAEIYASMIRFLMRAQGWFEENRFMRGLHSITKPKELQYDDLLANIRSSTANFRNLAVAAAQAEQRDMHLLLLEMKQMMITNQQINSSAQLNTNLVLTDLQFSQILTFLSDSPLEDPSNAFTAALYLSNRNRRNPKAMSEPFWLNPKFLAWTRPQTSSLIMVKGSYGSRQTVRDFLTNAVSCIREAHVPIIWALNTADSISNGISIVELLKYLTHQALQQGSLPTERFVALNCARFQTARSESEWFGNLAAGLANLKRIYIAVDLDVLAPELIDVGGELSLLNRFSKLLDDLKTESPKSVVKVVIVSCRSQILSHVTDEDRGRFISVGKPKPKGARAITKTTGTLSLRGQLRRGFS
ncbi:hypothetical protein F4808DRAFT_452086 [Astrocystis sublimbata]|nr:hypothetical protein F4808DRAFT_452086 [Astrocystis sublimbata]